MLLESAKMYVPPALAAAVPGAAARPPARVRNPTASGELERAETVILIVFTCIESTHSRAVSTRSRSGGNLSQSSSHAECVLCEMVFAAGGSRRILTLLCRVLHVWSPDVIRISAKKRNI